MIVTPLVRYLATLPSDDLRRVRGENLRELELARERVCLLEYEGRLLDKALDPAIRRAAAKKVAALAAVGVPAATGTSE